MRHKDQRFFILDYETTGVDPEVDLPIEIGIIVTDSEFNLLDTFQSLIDWRKRSTRKLENTECFDREHCFIPDTIHKISPKMIEDGGYSPEQVALTVMMLAKTHTTSRKPILLSDNIQFEWSFTKILLANEVWPFHYCGWDSSLFLEVAGVGDPKPVHRALADAGVLHAAILKSIGGLK